MIKFFRNIRQRMIKENKVSRYLLYAIGEIVLVVIGILIALKINNWNEQRKQDIERIQYQKSLHDDLVLDTLMLNEGIASYEKTLKEINALFRRIYIGDANLDTLKTIVQSEYQPGLATIRNLNSSTFNSMEASGKLDLFRSGLKSAILKHFLIQKSALQLCEITVKANLDQTLDFNKKYPFELGTNGYMGRTAWSNIDERDFAMGFNSVIGYHHHALQLNLKTYYELLDSTRDLLTLLKTEK